MPTVEHLKIEPQTGYRSQEVALLVALLDDQSALLAKDIADITPDELGWQPKPGMNTIGMLLAHMPIVEVYWTKLALAGEDKPKVDPVLGIALEDDGMPNPEEGRPPATLAGKDVEFYRDLHRRSREYLRKMAAEVPDSDLARELTRTRPNGTQRIYSIRWYFYHILEHFSGHYGQILLLRHLYKTVRVPAKA
jgi:uncharacterized damage-inducible protein DinB